MLAKCSLSSLNGAVTIPASKSIMQRACAAALLHKGTTIIHNPGISNDDRAALQVIQQLGAAVAEVDGGLRITSNGIAPVSDTIHCCESGLTARLFVPIAALAGELITITGEGSLLNRPFGVYADILPGLDVHIAGNGRLPLAVQGPLQAKNITIDGSLSSQFISGLLFAYAYAAVEPVVITVKDLNSRPYIDLTLDILRMFGRPVRHHQYETFFIEPAAFTVVDDVAITIEGDWSSAAALMVGAAISGYVTCKGINSDSQQADRALLGVLQQVGAGIEIAKDSVVVSSAALLQPFYFDATHSPDLFPVLAILAACCNGESRIMGLARLVHKESDRAQSIAAMLNQLQVPHALDGDTLIVQGVAKFPSTIIDAYNDHRIAMAAAVAALHADGEITIQGAEAVNKSYPRFYEDLRSLGAVVNFIA